MMSLEFFWTVPAQKSRLSEEKARAEISGEQEKEVLSTARKVCSGPCLAKEVMTRLAPAG